MLPPGRPLYDAASTRALEQHAIEHSGVSGLTLMRRAGAAVFATLRARWPAARRLAVVCGAGNNGGDGFEIARLAGAAGLAVDVILVGDPARIRGDAAACYADLRAAGLEPGANWSVLATADVIVDALFGTGLDRAVTGAQADAIAAINAAGRPVVAVDVPSGINATTGLRLGDAVRADVTVSLVTLKQGLVTGDAPDYTGALVCDDIALAPASFHAVPPSAAAYAYAECRAAFRPRPRTAHKGQNGHVLVIGGAPGFGGAARMAAEAAARCGAGLVSLATHPAHAAALTASRPEIMCHAVATTADLAPLLARATVVAIGPGLGQSAWASALWGAVRHCGQPQVVDADGLNLLAADPDSRALRVLTPHPGEAARLLAGTTAVIQADRFAAASALVARYGGVALLKGAGTVVAAPDAPPAVVCDGNPGMASGGMGDVLTGVIAALLAQGWSPRDAAVLGASVHGFAADRAVAEGGERGLLAADLMPFLRVAVNGGAR